MHSSLKLYLNACQLQLFKQAEPANITIAMPLTLPKIPSEDLKSNGSAVPHLANHDLIIKIKNKRLACMHCSIRKHCQHSRRVTIWFSDQTKIRQSSDRKSKWIFHTNILTIIILLSLKSNLCKLDSKALLGAHCAGEFISRGVWWAQKSRVTSHINIIKQNSVNISTLSGHHFSILVHTYMLEAPMIFELMQSLYSRHIP